MNSNRGTLLLTAVLCFIATVGLFLIPPSLCQSHGADHDPVDEYGGIAVRVGRPTGFFHTGKIGNRWVFVDPLGHPFWMLGIFNMGTVGSQLPSGTTSDEIILRKYGSRQSWAVQTLRRMASWGFNTVAEYHSAYLDPDHLTAGMAPKPVMLDLNASLYGLRDRGNYAPGPFKSLIDCQNPKVFHGWNGNGTPDVFDPNFAAYVEGALASHVIQGHPTTTNPFAGTWTQLRDSPWVIGVTTDDADYLQGFGSGPTLPTPDGVVTVHIGWLALAASITKTSSAKYGVAYSTPTVYTKKALHDFLKQKYQNSIAALNVAWGSHYTTFDSNGGWGTGSGLMDEDGRHTDWLGNADGTLRGASPGAKRDLDAFLSVFARKYFSITAGAIHQYMPHALVWAPASLNGHEGVTREPILEAAGQYVDVLNAAIRDQQALDLTAQYFGDKPIVTWEGNTANPDSDLFAYPRNRGVTTQAERSQWYAKRVQFLFQARTAAGTHPVAGLKLWDLYDSWAEKANWGLVSLLDNPYDGKADVPAPGKDARGYPTGGEVRNYGDFISTVQAANFEVLQELRDFVAQRALVRPQGKQN